jgi:hypothetical protein
MTRHAFLGRIFACSVALGLAATSALAASASGKLIHANGSPASGITVTLANNQGRSAPAQSAGDGAYTLTNIPAGQYYLEVWAGAKPPMTYQVTITQPNTLLPQVTVP